MKTGVMPANFKLYGNKLFSKDSFGTFSKTLAVASELIFSPLGGILFMADYFLGLISLIFFYRIAQRNLFEWKRILIVYFFFNEDDVWMVFVLGIGYWYFHGSINCINNITGIMINDERIFIFV